MKQLKNIIPDELTFNYKDEAFTDSRILAIGAGIEHASVIKLITTHPTICLELQKQADRKENYDKKCRRIDIPF